MLLLWGLAGGEAPSRSQALSAWYDGKDSILGPRKPALGFVAMGKALPPSASGSHV